MRDSLRRHLSFANVTSVLALFVALGGVGYAASQLPKNSVGSKQIKNGQVKAKDLREGSVTSPAVANGSLLGEDFAAGQLPAGGSPDTPSQVLDKIKQVDGERSGLDADQLDGVGSSGYVQEVLQVSRPFNPPSLTTGQCTNDFFIADVPLQSTDTVVVSPDNGRLDFQVTPFGPFGQQLYAVVCNHGSPIDLGPFNLNYRVLR
jgi:hypothetical protein